MTRIRLGISSCLLGEHVRFDGGHKRDGFLVDTFGAFVDWVPVCPEAECGLGTPRESMRLVGGRDGVRLLTVKSRVDVTDRVQAFVSERVDTLRADDLCGFVLKKDSPTCGVERVKVYNAHDVPTRSGRGLFAAALRATYPHLPIEEEGRLSDPVLRDNFVERVFAYGRLRQLLRSRWTVGELVCFHTAQKLALLAHAPHHYRTLGRIVAAARSTPRRDVEEAYSHAFMTAFEVIATRARHVNVLQHAAGYFKKQLDRPSKAELIGVIDEYRRGLVPLIVPITLVRHYVRVYELSYLAGQTYFEPHPKELMLRNHV
jgi:uncharacterized protein YbgA (DUF1722 family)/uncharacterized protein YbbK (DUF523 family)